MPAAGPPRNVVVTEQSRWFVYMLRTRAGALYTGITTDLERRQQQHETGRLGARSLRGKGPLQLVWHCEVLDRSTASKLEAAIKRLSKPDKERIVRGDPPPQV